MTSNILETVPYCLKTAQNSHSLWCKIQHLLCGVVVRMQAQWTFYPPSPILRHNWSNWIPQLVQSWLLDLGQNSFAPCIISGLVLANQMLTSTLTQLDQMRHTSGPVLVYLWLASTWYNTDKSPACRNRKQQHEWRGSSPHVRDYLHSPVSLVQTPSYHPNFKPKSPKLHPLQVGCTSVILGVSNTVLPR